MTEYFIAGWFIIVVVFFVWLEFQFFGKGDDDEIQLRDENPD